MTGKDYFVFVFYGSVLVPSRGRRAGARGGDTGGGGSRRSNMSNKLDVPSRCASDREGLHHGR